MGSWPSMLGSGRIHTEGAVGASSRGTNITSAASANGLGSWVVISASTAIDAFGIHLNTAIKDPGSTDVLLDIGIGASGAEKPIIERLLLSHSLGNEGSVNGWFPVFIPAGTRLVARARGLVASSIVSVTVQLLRENWLGLAGCAKVVSWGHDETTTGGQAVVPGATGAEGSWTQVIAATASDQPAKGFYVALGNSGDFTRTALNVLFDIGIGAAGAEKPILENLHFWGETTNDSVMPAFFGPFFFPIPAGTRIAARGQGDAAAENFDVVVYGIL